MNRQAPFFTASLAVLLLAFTPAETYAQAPEIRFDHNHTFGEVVEYLEAVTEARNLWILARKPDFLHFRKGCQITFDPGFRLRSHCSFLVKIPVSPNTDGFLAQAVEPVL